MRTSPRVFWQVFLVISGLLSLPAFFETLHQVEILGIDLWRSKWIGLLAVCLLNSLAAPVLAIWLNSRQAGEILARPALHYPPTFLIRGTGFIILVAGFSSTWLFKFVVFTDVLPRLYPLLWIFWWMSLPQMLGLRMMFGLPREAAFSAVIVSHAVCYRILSQIPNLSTYPFSLGWSEASRYYYASLPFAKRLYGMDVALSVWHPTRYFLQSIPFLFGGQPIWVHRLWQVALWIGLSGVSGWVLARRLKLGRSGLAWLVGGWFFSYLLQGAVYYHLQVCVILVMAGVSLRHNWRTLLVVVLASMWAWMSRLNWNPVQAMLAIGIYLLEEPVNSNATIWHYLVKPAVWAGSGMAAALTGQAAYIWISGNGDLQAFGSSLTSDLLWYRLLPNPTYPLGVLPGILLVSAPLVLVVIQTLRRQDWHPIRQVGLWGMGLVLFGGGLLVSTKIGGGGDLHNMDAYMVMVGLVGTYLYFGRGTPDGSGVAAGGVSWAVVAVGVLIPAVLAVQALPSRMVVGYNHERVEWEVYELDRVVKQVAQQGEVLFINERHLLTLETIDAVRLVPEYEMLTLMEMVISDNQPYLAGFYADIRGHRFAAIVVRKQFLVIKEDAPFAEENNAWTRMISPVLLCEYHPVLTLNSSNVQVLVPNEQSGHCP